MGQFSGNLSRRLRSKQVRIRFEEGLEGERIPVVAFEDPKLKPAVEQFFDQMQGLDPVLLRTHECFRCDASVVFEQYCLKPEAWALTGVEDWGGMLCVGCCEAAIGRRLRPDDFVAGHAFLHPEFPKSTRLRKRLAGEA